MLATNGKINWLAQDLRPDFMFQWCNWQQKAKNATLSDLLEVNRMVHQPKKHNHLSLKYTRLEDDTVIVVTLVDAAFANVVEASGDVPLASHGGYVIGRTSSSTATSRRINVVMWPSHKLKRKIRNTLAAETLAANEAVEAIDLVQAYLAELDGGGPLPKKQWECHVALFPQVIITDSKSVFDHLQKQGSTPGDERLRLDMNILLDQMEDQRVLVKWISTEQQAADALTKGSTKALACLKLVLETNLVYFIDDPRVKDLGTEYAAKNHLKKTQKYEQQQKEDEVSEGDVAQDLALVRVFARLA